MLETRPIIPITIGYIIGIIIGLYIKLSIAFFYVLFFFIYTIIKIKIKIKLKLKKQKRKKLRILSFSRFKRYLKIFFTKKIILIIIISSIISNVITIYQNKKYNELYKFNDNDDIIIIGKMISNGKEKEYKDIYKIKIDTVNNNKKYKNTNLYIYVKKNKDVKFKYGDIVKIRGKYKNAEQSRNFKGFNYKEYLKTLKIYGIVNLENFELINKNKVTENFFDKFFESINSCFLHIKDNVESSLDKDIASIVIGLTLGFKDDIDEDIKQDFSESNLTYILAISGMHIGYITMFICFIFDKIFKKGKSKIFTCIVLLFYMFITGFYPSVVRAGINAIIVLLSHLFHRKSDLWNNLYISLLILLIYNPFLIKDISLLLSFGGTIGILVFNKNILNWFVILEKNYEEKNKRKKRIIKLRGIVLKFYIKLKEAVSLTISANLIIIPIIVLTFNKLPMTSLIICFLVSITIAPIIIFCFLYIIVVNIVKINIFNLIITFIINNLINIARFTSTIIFHNIYIIVPNKIEIFIYYFIIFISNDLFKIYHKKRLSITQKRIKNILSLIKFRFNQNKQKIISIFLILILISMVTINIPKSLQIFFIDVGQGDSTFIVTPMGKKILIDGGGSEDRSYDVGKNILLPYLLNRRVKKIDYIFVSHFDSDHVGGLFTVMEELNVGQIIISKQKENSENYQKFKKIVNEKKIKVIIVSKGAKLEIEKNLYFKILWPDNSKLISQNILNNYSIVCKLCYNNFSILFTGDIEEIAEKQILQEYQDNTKIFKSTVLKVAHHGSKTSSIEDFLDIVKPDIALIGVGKGNKFGHPSNKVIERLQNCGCKIYRTDEMGEIFITVNNKGIIKTKKFIN